MLYIMKKIYGRNLLACKGNGFMYRLLMRFFPSFYKMSLGNYNQQQLLRMLICHDGERYREDFSACLQAMLKE